MKLYIFSETGSYGSDFYVMSDSKENALMAIKNYLNNGDKWDKETLMNIERYEVYEYEEGEVVIGERC